MKTKLHKTLFFSALALLGMQAVSAQYVGVPFPDKDTAPQIGVTQNVATRIELENFDSAEDGTGFYIDGLNSGVTTTSIPETATYNDKSAGSTGTNTTYRSGSDVDLDNQGTGIVLGKIQGQEYTLYTVEIMEDGDYDFVINYRINSGAGDKNFQLFLREATDLSSISGGTIYNAPLPNTESAYANHTLKTNQVMTAGTYVLFCRFVASGPRYDYIEVTRTSTLSVEENKLKASKFKAYPNPANDGIFNLNIEAKWDVYSLIGTKILEGEGKEVDLSTFAKGAYILRTPFTSKMLISK